MTDGIIAIGFTGLLIFIWSVVSHLRSLDD